MLRAGLPELSGKSWPPINADERGFGLRIEVVQLLFLDRYGFSETSSS
jgi:hypothetical protein